MELVWDFLSFFFFEGWGGSHIDSDHNCDFANER